MKPAILFPGQGAQHVGMGRELYEASRDVQTMYARAADILGCDIAAISFEGPVEELTRSDRAQPAIFLHSVAALMAVELEVGAGVTAGLSSGEWAALYYGGAVELEDALKALEARGRLMQEACAEQPGGMLVTIGLDREKLEEICAGTGIEIANLNSPVQTILSGPIAGIEAAEPLAKEKGAKISKKLDVAGAFHSSLMAGAAERFAEVIKDIPFRAPTRTVLSNVTGEAHGDDPEVIKTRMVEQITSSVHWIDNTACMKALGVDRYIECGPGKVLTGLIKRMHGDAEFYNIQTADDAKSVIDQTK